MKFIPRIVFPSVLPATLIGLLLYSADPRAAYAADSGPTVPLATQVGTFGDGLAAYNRQDFKTAAQIWRPLAENGNPKAQNNIAVMYKDGAGGYQQDYAEAMRWFQKAADQGLGLAQFNIGDLYSRGEGVPTDYAKAREWYLRAADQGDAGAQFNVAEKMEYGMLPFNQKGLLEPAFHLYLKAAIQGYNIAQRSVSVMYEHGRGVQQDYEEAYFWDFLFGSEPYRPVTSKHLTPERVEAVKARVRAWLQDEAGKGSNWAGCSLGEMYSYGDGVQRDDVEAMKWYRHSADRGWPYAQYRIGEMYASGSGVSKDPVEALFWHMLAAENGLTFPYLPRKSFEESAARQMAPGQIDAVRQRVQAWRPLDATQAGTPVVNTK